MSIPLNKVKLCQARSFHGAMEVYWEEVWLAQREVFELMNTLLARLLLKLEPATCP
jgi:hypothetical protein